jgi:hypothetical protein
VPAVAAPETPSWAWGTWATPSCEAPEVVSFGTDQLVIARNREGQVWAFAKEAFVQAGADWVRVRYGSGLSRHVQLARPEGEDRLQIADFLGPAPPSDAELAAGTVEPAAPAWRLTEWQRCDSVPGEAALGPRRAGGRAGLVARGAGRLRRRRRGVVRCRRAPRG